MSPLQQPKLTETRFLCLLNIMISRGNNSPSNVMEMLLPWKWLKTQQTVELFNCVIVWTLQRGEAKPLIHRSDRATILQSWHLLLTFQHLEGIQRFWSMEYMFDKDKTRLSSMPCWQKEVLVCPESAKLTSYTKYWTLVVWSIFSQMLMGVWRDASKDQLCTDH